MEEISVLLFDDEDDLEENHRYHIDTAIRTYATEALHEEVSVNIECKALRSEILSEIKSNLDAYDLFICDLLVKDAKGERMKNQGWAYIKGARRQSEDLAIIAWTQGGYDIQGEKYTEADGFQAKTILEDEASYFDFGEKIFEALRRRNAEKFLNRIPIEYDETDVSHLDLIEKISEPILSELCYQAIRQSPQIPRKGESVQGLPDGLTAKIHVIEAGLSGAGVFWVEYWSDDGRHPDLLIKYSMQKRTIEKELAARRVFLDAFGELFVKAGFDGLIHQGDVYAIAMPFKRGSIGILDWFRTNNSSKTRVGALLKRMWLEDGFNHTFSLVSKVEAGPGQFFNSVAVDKILTHGHKARILHFLEELKRINELLPDQYSQEIDFERLELFVRSGTVGSLRDDFFSTDIFEVGSHGDFHCGNILVSGQHLASAIDPPSISKLPWPADLARFSVDVLMRGVDSRVNILLFETVESWLQALTPFVMCEQIEGEWDGFNNGAIHALNWIVGNLGEIASFSDHLSARKEFRVCIMIELMRAVYRIEWYTAQQRLFACALASRLIDKLHEEYATAS
jgi:hypothetical protein